MKPTACCGARTAARGCIPRLRVCSLRHSGLLSVGIFQLCKSVLVNFCDACEGADIFGIGLNGGAEVVCVAGEEFEAHHDSFNAFVCIHGERVCPVFIVAHCSACVKEVSP